MELLLTLLIMIPGTWHWDEVLGHCDLNPTTTCLSSSECVGPGDFCDGLPSGYKFCWSHYPGQWNLGLCVDRDLNLFYLPSIEMDMVWAIEQRPGSVIYYQVIAYNSVGYDAVGAMFAPTPPEWVCP